MAGSSRAAGSARTRGAVRSASRGRGRGEGPRRARARTARRPRGRGGCRLGPRTWRSRDRQRARRARIHPGRVAMKTAVLLGAGGLGCPAALALAEEKAGLRLIIVDPDRIERSNLARQILYGEADIGAAKAEIPAGRTCAEARAERFDGATANALRPY